MNIFVDKALPMIYTGDFQIEKKGLNQMVHFISKKISGDSDEGNDCCCSCCCSCCKMGSSSNSKRRLVILKKLVEVVVAVVIFVVVNIDLVFAGTTKYI